MFKSANLSLVLFDIRCHCHRFLRGINEDPQKRVIQVRATQQDVVKGDAVMLGAGVEHCSHLACLYLVSTNTLVPDPVLGLVQHDLPGRFSA